MGIDLTLGLATGIAFGFLLQKGRVLRFGKQVGAMLFKDMTIFKFMCVFHGIVNSISPKRDRGFTKA